MPSIDPQNLSAQLQYRGRGNPPNSHAKTSISNCFPGLEFDFRGIWKHIFVGIELHEAYNYVLEVSDPSLSQQGVVAEMFLVEVDGDPVQVAARGPGPTGADADLGNTNLEWTNSLARIVTEHSGNSVACKFVSEDGNTTVDAQLTVRKLFENGSLAAETIPPGTLTQGLCSPWQADYRECGCYYWAASRPDFVNPEPSGADTIGHNWMLKVRTDANKAPSQNNVTWDRLGAADQWNYEDLYRAWEEHLKFIIAGKDSE